MKNEIHLALLCMAAAPALAQMVTQVPAIQRYSLSSDAQFGFGRSALDPAGEAKLDDLVNRFRDVRIERITGTGHSDRIGGRRKSNRKSPRAEPNR